MRRIGRMVDALLARTRFERDMREEIRQHVEHRTLDLIAAGLSPADAKRRARLEFGAAETYKEQCRDTRGFAAFRPFHGLAGDVQFAARRLLATPQFLMFAVFSLAVGIGVTTSVYSILYSLVWKPLGISEPDRVVLVATRDAALTGRMYVSYPDFEDLRASTRTLGIVAASARFYQTIVTPEASDVLEGEAVSGEYFRAAGVVAVIGRTIQPADDESAARVIVLNHRIWRSRFGADPNVVGRVVRLGGQSFEVIGVAARSFDGLERSPVGAGAWIPLRAITAFGAVSASTFASRERRQLTILGRLTIGGTPAAAAAELGAIAGRLDTEFPYRTTQFGAQSPATLPRGWSARGIGQIRDSDARMAAFIIALVALVLVVACTNLANLMLSRGAARQREMAVRRALGASRWRLVRELLVESAIVAIIGGAAGLALIRVLLVMASIEVPMRWGTFRLEPEMNLPAVFAAAAALLLSLLVFGLEPALQLTRAQVTPDLGGGDAAVGSVRAGRQRAFIRWQVATSATFFLIAAILAKVVALEARHDPGIDIDRLAIATTSLPAQTWDQPRARRVMSAAAEILRQEHGIESVAVSSGVPFGLPGSWARATTPDKPFFPNRLYEMTDLIAATPEIFRTLGVGIVRGRAFDYRDDASAPKVMVVSEKTARTFFGTTDAIGRQLMVQAWGRPPTETYTIVGVARDTDSGHLMSRGNDTTYVPLAQHYEPRFVVLARTAGDPASVAGLIQKAVRLADPDVALSSVGPASTLLSGPYFAARIAASLAGALGALTLLLSMVGLYGVQAHLVAQRTRELGVRMAIGASREHIQRMVLREGLRPVLEGVVLGMLLAVVARLGLRALVSASIQPIDPVAFPLVPIPLFIAAFVACYVPARRASRVDPNVALRHL